jgi:signal transduction histidine kinase
VETSAEIEDMQIRLQVKDTGIGIPEQELPRIFDKFYRVNTKEHRKVPGTGLGLSIAQKIVQQHGGKMWVHSRPGVGSTFCFSLPLDKEGDLVS